jgi:predicted dehydrogenase
MYKALIIGCGNIGALYDFETESVSSYAKAFHLDPEIEFEIYDIDPKISAKVAERYCVRCLHELSPAIYQNYDIVAICTPTFTHHEYLCNVLELGPSLVICEKPVDVDRVRLEQLLKLYRNSNSKVMVNFFRRFQPGMNQLRQEIELILAEEQCTNIVVSYQRGFHNNASHAIDLLQFLFGTTIDLSGVKVTHRALDEFETDPTMSLSCVWNGVNVQFIGLAHVEFSLFEIAIYFARKSVLIKECGNKIELLCTPAPSGNFYPKIHLQSQQSGVIENYMVSVVSHAKRLLKGDETHDNFLESASISERVLKIQGR